MEKLLETIKIVDGFPQFLEFHQRRFNASRAQLFGCNAEIALENFIQPPKNDGIYKCRLVYAKTVETVEYFPYKMGSYNVFKVMTHQTIDYSFKWCERAIFNQLFAQKGEADDILIIRQGLVTDTTIANVAFLWQGQWITPATPLLKGTTRERLLEEKLLIERDIYVDELAQFSTMAMMNAMVGFHPIAQVVFI